MTKWCPRCSTDKPVDQFPRNRSRADGLHSTRKPCASAASWAYQKRVRAQKLIETQAREIALSTRVVRIE